MKATAQRTAMTCLILRLRLTLQMAQLLENHSMHVYKMLDAKSFARKTINIQNPEMPHLIKAITQLNQSVVPTITYNQSKTSKKHPKTIKHIQQYSIAFKRFQKHSQMMSNDVKLC